ncbi:MAG TPA: carbohydrate ABC transporter permease [Anaeromyxobacter sp.]|nr:carbohydrate ABC transporter permease [Anaeromyxobacter sp.]
MVQTRNSGPRGRPRGSRLTPPPTSGTRRPRRGGGRLERPTALQILGVALLCLLGLIYLYPLFWLLDSSFRPAVDIFQFPPLIFRDFGAAMKGYTLGSFRSAFGHWNVGLSFGVSVVVTLSGIALTLLVCSLCAYAFAYLEFPFRRVLFAVILGTMMLPMTTMIVPFYRVVRSLGISNSLLGLVIPYSVSAFGVFLLRQYYIKIPRSLMESAKTEGAGHLRIWWSIILPLSRPALAALAIVQFRAIWNDFLFPMIILKSDRLYTLPIRIQVMDSQNFNKPYEAIISAGFITALVPMVFFLLFQRHFIEGLAGGTKE